jgi:hypothetical protein
MQVHKGVYVPIAHESEMDDMSGGFGKSTRFELPYLNDSAFCLVPKVCIIYIGVVSVVSVYIVYNCVYYCDTLCLLL